jgi:hypothetical protein
VQKEIQERMWTNVLLFLWYANREITVYDSCVERHTTVHAKLPEQKETVLKLFNYELRPATPCCGPVFKVAMALQRP